MTKEKTVGRYCRGCEGLIPLARLECRCMASIPEAKYDEYRRANWKPAYIHETVTMETANQ